jgi:8-hydroxy-5-deazaflavin:NADPH oxidoreductase
VSIANSRGPETLRGLASETGATPVTVPEAAVRAYFKNS